MEGKKYDGDKPRPDYIYPIALLEEGAVMAYGAKKYGAGNYLAGMAWSRLVGAALRHILAWSSGEEVDHETNLSHLAHARCCLGMLMAYQDNEIGEDDRIYTYIDRDLRG